MHGPSARSFLMSEIFIMFIFINMLALSEILEKIRCRESDDLGWSWQAKR